MRGLEEGDIDLDGVDYDVPSLQEEKVTSYFFGQKTAIRAGVLPGLDLVNEHLASSMSHLLSNKLGREVYVQPKVTSTQIFGRYLHSLDPPIFMSKLRVEPYGLPAIFSIGGSVCFCLLEGYFGGNGDSERPFRNLSPLEMEIIDRVFDVARNKVEESWKKIDPDFRFIVEDVENQPQFAAVMDLDATVFLMSFSVEVGDEEDTLTLCFPSEIIQKSSKKLKHGVFKGENETLPPELLNNVPLPVSFSFCRFDFSLNSLMSLEVGDVLRWRMTDHVVIEVGDVPKYMGRYRVACEKGDTSFVEVLEDFTDFDRRVVRFMSEKTDINRVADIPVEVSVRIGTKTMQVADILKMCKGYLIELDKEADDPLELYVNGKVIAYGEVVMIKDKLGLRITDVAGKKAVDS